MNSSSKHIVFLKNFLHCLQEKHRCVVFVLRQSGQTPVGGALLFLPSATITQTRLDWLSSSSVDITQSAKEKRKEGHMCDANPAV